MKYNMNVIIYDPETEEGMNSDVMFDLTVTFTHDATDCGNGYHVSITCGTIYEEQIDLRNDNTFDPMNKIEWIKHWARDFWHGTNGVYAISSLNITKVKDN